MSKYEFVKFDGNNNLWDEINLSVPYSTFLTTSGWIEFQQSLGKNIRRYYIQVDGEYRGILNFEITIRKYSKYIYAPYSPVIAVDFLTSEFFTELKHFVLPKIAKHKVNVFRFDMPISEKNRYIIQNAGFKKSLAAVQATHLWEINVDRPLEEIKSDMSKSTKYNINKGLREEIDIVEATTLEEVKEFTDLMIETTSRKGFINFASDYFTDQFQDLNKKGLTKVFLAKYKGKTISGALVNIFNKTAYYTHGCSTSDKNLSKLRSPYPLHWEIIRRLKEEQGIKIYNMWGVIPEKHNNRSLKGVSDFKRSFGGYQRDLIGPFECFINPFNYVFQLFYDFIIYRNDRF